MRKGVRFFAWFLAILLFLPGCPEDPTEKPTGSYRDEMRALVESISAHAKSLNPSFLIVPHNGEQLLTTDGTAGGSTSVAYVNSIDGQACDDVFYGYIENDSATPPGQRDAMLALLDWAEGLGIQALVIDHCTTASRVDTSYAWNANRGYISTATCRAANTIPCYPAQPYAMNQDDVVTLADARNFLLFLDSTAYGTSPSFLWAMNVTNFDVLVIDPCFWGLMLTANQVDSLKTKANGGKRLVLAYLNIGQADSQSSYWRSSWEPDDPVWLGENVGGSCYLAQYWHSQWKEILFGNPNACLDQILAAGFDGVYLDGIEAYQWYE